MISTGFTFDGVHSSTMGVQLARKESGLFPITYVSAQEIIENYPSRAKAPFFSRTKKTPLTLPTLYITSTSEADFTSAKLKTIANWLFKDTYRQFVSDDNADKTLYVMATNQADFTTNGLDQGYVEITFRSQFPYAITSSAPTFDLSTNSGTTAITVNCLANVHTYYYPEIQIDLQSTDTAFSLTNVTDSSRVTSFTGLTIGESIELDNGKKQIISDTTNYRYANFNKNWFRLLPGTNTINVTGHVVLTFRCEYPVFA